MLTQLLYVSVSDIPADAPNLEHEIAQILSTSYIRNEQAGVTGLLLYAGGYYCQLLEGEGDAVDEVFARVEQDGRHKQINVLLKRATDWMLLPDYPMGCAGIERKVDDLVADAVGLKGWMSISEAAPAVLYSLLSRVPETDLVLENPDQLSELINSELKL